LGTHKSFISQITNPTYRVPVPARHVAAIMRICHFVPEERRAFLDAGDRDATHVRIACRSSATRAAEGTRSGSWRVRTAPGWQALRKERQESWLDGLESALARFGGVPEEVLFDNARALVDRHDTVSREVVFNAKLKAFARHWGFRQRACAPYRARTKGKTENGVDSIKKNAIAGRGFASREAFEAHLEAWMREVADVRVHGTAGEPPILRFRRDEEAILQLCQNGRRPVGDRGLDQSHLKLVAGGNHLCRTATRWSRVSLRRHAQTEIDLDQNAAVLSSSLPTDTQRKDRQ
jgi:hypothetical protein